MRILIIGDRLYPTYKKGMKSGAYIAETRIAVALKNSGHDIHIYSDMIFNNDDCCDGLHYIGKSKLEILFSLSLRSLKLMKNYYLHSKLSFKKKIKETVKISECGYLEKIINKGHYDIISYQSFTNASIYLLLDLDLKNVVYTIHGILNGIVEIECSNKKWLDVLYEKEILEKKFYDQCIAKCYQIVFVSSGLMRQVADLERIEYIPSFFHYIPNIVDANSENKRQTDIRRKYNIPIDAKILVCSGTVCVRKNQKQLVESLALFPKSQLNNIRLLICGTEQVDLHPLISKLQLDNNVIITGFVESDVMDSIYSVADAVIVASIYETFGMPIIEAYGFGKPVVMPSDLKAFDDCYSENTCIAWKGRTTQGLTNAIEIVLEKKWNSAIIKEFIQKFSSNKVGSLYNSLFNNIYENVQINSSINRVNAI